MDARLTMLLLSHLLSRMCLHLAQPKARPPGPPPHRPPSSPLYVAYNAGRPSEEPRPPLGVVPQPLPLSEAPRHGGTATFGGSRGRMRRSRNRWTYRRQDLRHRRGATAASVTTKTDRNVRGG